jgi:hypothetical protein
MFIVDKQCVVVCWGVARSFKPEMAGQFSILGLNNFYQ